MNQMRDKSDIDCGNFPGMLLRLGLDFFHLEWINAQRLPFLVSNVCLHRFGDTEGGQQFFRQIGPISWRKKEGLNPVMS